MELLPSELKLEILSRTTLEALEACKSVSKSWNEIIYEPTFLHLHTQRTNSIFGYFFQTQISSKSCSAFVSTAPGAIETTWPGKEGYEILASCDQGIVVCRREGYHNNQFWYACKPATDQWQLLPRPKLRYNTESVAVVVVRSQPLRYIIVRLSESAWSNLQHECEIFDSERWRWERIGSDSLPPYGETVTNTYPAVTTAGRFVHWLTLPNNVLQLDLWEKRFECYPLPEFVPKSEWTRPTLVEYKGGLGFMCEHGKGDLKKLEVWMKGEKSVELKMGDIPLRLPCAVEFCSADVLFLTIFGGAYFYNMQDSSVSKVEVPWYLWTAKQVFRFRSDTEVVDLKATRRLGNSTPH